ncbi:MAG TPA: RNA methyltransferase [Phycisphaerales bacterium]|nr:RNA methyltransferase [Phycisphaerales bacterium]
MEIPARLHERLERIVDADDPRVEVYRNQKDQWLRARAEGGTGLTGGLFMAEGELVVRTLLRSRFEPVSALVAENRVGALADALAALPRGVPVYVGSRAVVEAIVGFDLHRGVLACGRVGMPMDAESVMRRAAALVVAEELSNHDNLGSIFRSAGALVGPERAGVLLGPRCCDPLYRKCLRVSMGCALQVPFARLEPWPDGLGVVRASGFTLIALTPGEDAVPIDEVAARAACVPGFRPALLVGAEGPGLSEGATAGAELRVRIPISVGVDSLNAAVAAAIALHRLAGLAGR